MIRQIIFVLAFVILIHDSSFAAITQETVNAAWKRIAKADGFRVIPITYEQNDSPNAWVKFKSQKNFSVHVTTGLMKIL
ncbi:MAG: peptidase M48, partial [Synergistaceae bacterium]|nr:peptidase M48 [Synergistaceae bacterium]